MNYYTTYLKNDKGENFLGLRIEDSEIKIWLDQLKELIGESDFEVFSRNQQLRDNSKYYLSIISVDDYHKCIEFWGMDNFINNLDERLFQFEIDDLQFKGLGTNTDGPNRAFYVVCKSDKISAVRSRFELPPLDLHITIGFDKKDISGVRKDQLLKKGPKFLKLLELEYYKNKNWDFIKKIQNYSLDIDIDLEPVDITETSVKFKCGNHYLQVVYLEDGERFWVGTVSPIIDENPILNDTQITQFFNKNYN